MPPSDGPEVVFVPRQPIVPKDIILLVIEEYSRDPATRIYDLLTVSSGFFEGALPFLYHTVVPRNECQAQAYVDAVNGRYLFCKPARHVRRLWLNYSLHNHPTLSRLIGTLEKCPNLQQLSYGPRRDANLVIVPPKPQSALTRLTVWRPSDSYWRIYDIRLVLSDLNMPLSCFTHLQFLCAGTFVFAFLETHTTKLTSLTHLALDMKISELFRRNEYNVGDPNLAESRYPPWIVLLRGLYIHIPSLKEIFITLTQWRTHTRPEDIVKDAIDRFGTPVPIVIVDRDIVRKAGCPPNSLVVRPFEFYLGEDAVEARMEFALRSWEY